MLDLKFFDKNVVFNYVFIYLITTTIGLFRPIFCKMNKYEGFVSRKGQFLATFVATIGSFGLGCVLSWPAPTLPQLSPSASSDHALVLSVEQQSWVAALLNFGAFTAGPVSGVLMPRYGKKWSMVQNFKHGNKYLYRQLSREGKFFWKR